MRDIGPNPIAAYLWVIAATFLFAIMYMPPKLVGAQASPFHVTQLRYIAGFLTIAPVYLIVRRGVSSRPSPPIQGIIPTVVDVDSI